MCDTNTGPETNSNELTADYITMLHDPVEVDPDIDRLKIETVVKSFELITYVLEIHTPSHPILPVVQVVLPWFPLQLTLY